MARAGCKVPFDFQSTPPMGGFLPCPRLLHGSRSGVARADIRKHVASPDLFCGFVAASDVTTDVAACLARRDAVSDHMMLRR